MGPCAGARRRPYLEFVINPAHIFNLTNRISRQLLELLGWHLARDQDKAVERDDADMSIVIRLVGSMDIDLRFCLDTLVGHLLTKGALPGVLFYRPRTRARHNRAATPKCTCQQDDYQ